jgi:hypothetical protein
VQLRTYQMYMNRQQSMRTVSNERIMNNLFCTERFTVPSPNFVFSLEGRSSFLCKHESERTSAVGIPSLSSPSYKRLRAKRHEI